MNELATLLRRFSLNPSFNQITLLSKRERETNSELISTSNSFQLTVSMDCKRSFQLAGTRGLCLKRL